jgi:hypothetical protein
MDVNALNNFHLEACLMGETNQVFNFIDRPDVTDSDVVKRADHTFNPRYLADMLKRNFILVWPKPAHCHLHHSCPFIQSCFCNYHTSIFQWRVKGANAQNHEVNVENPWPEVSQGGGYFRLNVR